MGKTRKFKAITTAVVMAAILAGSIIGYNVVQSARKAAQAAKAGRRDMAVTVQTSKVPTANMEEILTFNGDIQAMQSVELQPKISGRLLSLAFEDGKPVETGFRVKKGQLIGRIDDRDLKAKLAAANAALSVARANVLSAEAAILNSNASLEQKTAAHRSSVASVESAAAAREDKAREKARQETLLSKHATTQQNYDQALTAFDQAEAQLRQAKATAAAAEAQIKSAEADIQQAKANLERYRASVDEAEAALQQAEVNLSETRLYSPMDGVIGKKHIDPGSMVSPTTPVVTIFDMEVLRILLSVPVNQLPRIVPGKTRAQMRTAGLQDKAIDCVIYKVYPSVDLATRTATVEIRIKNIADQYDSFKIKPGMFAAVEVLIESRENVMAVDAALPIRNLDRNIIYKVEGDKVRAVDVKLGVRFDSKVEILSGLNEDDEIVVVGQHRLTDGAAIKVLKGNNLSF